MAGNSTSPKYPENVNGNYKKDAEHSDQISI